MKFFLYAQLAIVVLLGLPSICAIYLKPDIAFMIIIVLAVTSFAIWKIGETLARREYSQHGLDCDCDFCDPQYCDECERNAIDCNCEDDDEICEDCGFEDCECEESDTCSECGEFINDCECEERSVEMCDSCMYGIDECECEICAKCEEQECICEDEDND